jgi:homoserine kinase type II
MAHLAHAGSPVPKPEPDRSGALWSVLNGKPAGIASRLAGRPVLDPKAAHCAAAGKALAQMHVASSTYRSHLGNRRGPGWWRQAARAVRPYLAPAQNEMLAAELSFQTGFGKGSLPRGAIHGDLFCDNVLFSDVRVTGIIDFGFAATDFLAYDLAIAVNDWCVLRDHHCATGALDPVRVDAMVGAYCTIRPLDADERTNWRALLRAAALRFWVSRLYDLHLPRPGELTHAHDPAPFERILRTHVAMSREADTA